ncbi:MAG: copper chaperone PCu(A)C [Rhizobiaceae bacterium]
MRRFILPLAAACGLTIAYMTPATAHDDMAIAGNLEITHAWARAMLPNQPAGGGYLYISNTGSKPDRLVGVRSPVAGKVEIHTMEMVNDVMTMRPVEGGLEIPPDATVKLEPGGFHLMFMAVSDSFDEGETVPVTLEFERAGPVEIELPVGSREGGMPDHSGH